MNFKIVWDSSADVLSVDLVEFATVPLKIIVGEKEFVDDCNVDIENMLTTLEKYKGKSSSSCPNVANWLDSFGEAEGIFCVTITSGLSGSYTVPQRRQRNICPSIPTERCSLWTRFPQVPKVRLLLKS